MEKDKVNKLYEIFEFLTASEYIQAEYIHIYDASFDIMTNIDNPNFISRDFFDSRYDKTHKILSIAKTKDTELGSSIILLDNKPLEFISLGELIIDDIIYVKVGINFNVDQIKIINLKSKSAIAKFESKYYNVPNVVNLFFTNDGQLLTNPPSHDKYINLAIDNKIVNIYNASEKYHINTDILMTNVFIGIDNRNKPKYTGCAPFCPHVLKVTDTSLRTIISFSLPSHTKTAFKAIVESFRGNIALLDRPEMLPKSYDYMKDILQYKMNNVNVLQTFEEYITNYDFMFYDKFYDEELSDQRVIHMHTRDLKITKKTPIGNLDKDHIQIIVSTQSEFIKLLIFKNGRVMREIPKIIYDRNRFHIYIPTDSLNIGKDSITIIKQRPDFKVWTHTFTLDRMSTVHLPKIEKMYNAKIYLNGLYMEAGKDYEIINFELNKVLFFKRKVYVNDYVKLTYNTNPIENTVETYNISDDKLMTHKIHLERQEIYYNGELLNMYRFVDITTKKSVLNTTPRELYDDTDNKLIIYNHQPQVDEKYKSTEPSDYRNNIFKDPEVINYLKNYITQFNIEFEGKYNLYERKKYLMHMFFTLFLEYNRTVVCDPFSYGEFAEVIKENFAEIIDPDGFTMVLDCSVSGYPRDMYLPLPRRIPLDILKKANK